MGSQNWILGGVCALIPALESQSDTARWNIPVVGYFQSSWLLLSLIRPLAPFSFIKNFRQEVLFPSWEFPIRITRVLSLLKGY